MHPYGEGWVDFAELSPPLPWPCLPASHQTHTAHLWGSLKCGLIPALGLLVAVGLCPKAFA